MNSKKNEWELLKPVETPRHKVKTSSEQVGWLTGERCRIWHVNNFYIGQIKMITQGVCQVYCKSANITVEMPVSRVYPLSHFSTPDHGVSNKDMKWEVSDPCIAKNPETKKTARAWVQSIPSNGCIAVIFDDDEAMKTHVLPVVDVMQPHLFDPNFNLYKESMQADLQQEKRIKKQIDEIERLHRPEDDLEFIDLVIGGKFCRLHSDPETINEHIAVIQSINDHAFISPLHERLVTEDNGEGRIENEFVKDGDDILKLHRMKLKPIKYLMDKGIGDVSKLCNLAELILSAFKAKTVGVDEEVERNCEAATKYYNYLITLYLRMIDPNQ